MRRTATLINETPGKEVHHKQYLLNPPMNGYRHVLVTRVNRTITLSWDVDQHNNKIPKKTLTLKSTLIQAATSLGESTTKVLRRFEYGITSAEALKRARYTITN